MSDRARWYHDLPRAALRGQIAAVVIAALLVTFAVPLDALVADALLAVLVGLTAFTLVEGRVARATPPWRVSEEYLVLWPAATALAVAGVVQHRWVDGLLHGGLRQGVTELDTLVRQRWLIVLVCAAIGGLFVAVASVTLRRRSAQEAVILALLLCAWLLVPGVVLFFLLGTFMAGDRLAARLLRVRVEQDDVARLRWRTVARGEAPVRIWLLAYLGDPAARELLGESPQAPDQLDVWLARLVTSGPEACARAALACARLALPALRVARPDDARPAALVAAVEACLDGPGDATREAVGAAWVALEGVDQDPLLAAVRAAGQATLEAQDRSAGWAVAEQAVLAGTALVAAGHDPEEVRSTVADALRAWALPPEAAT